MGVLKKGLESKLANREKGWWEKFQQEESHEWETVRFAFWPIVAIGVFFWASIMMAPASDAVDFSQQALFFSCLGLVFFILGTVLGYRNPKPKKLWIAADFIWVMIVVISLQKNLSPVEAYFGSTELAGAARDKDKAHDEVLQETWAITDQFCAPLVANSKTAPSDICVPLQLFQRQVTLRNYQSMQSQSIAQLEKITVPPQVLAKLKEKLAQYDKDQQTERALKAKRDKINLWFPYLQILIVTLALGLRAGRTGAEYRREVDPPKAKIPEYKCLFSGKPLPLAATQSPRVTDPSLAPYSLCTVPVALKP